MNAPVFLGIEIGGTKLQLGIGSGDGRILALRRLKVDPARGAAGVRQQLAAGFVPLLSEAGVEAGAVTAVGIGFGGPVDAERGAVLRSFQVRGWEEYPIAEWAAETFGMRCVAVQNDADTAALGEARYGAGVGHSPVLYLTIGSGIGGGLILDNEIYRGSGLGAAEIGHLRVDCPSGLAGEDPNGVCIDELERISSGWSIGRTASAEVERRLKAGLATGRLGELALHDPARVDAALVAEAARDGDELARGVLARATAAVAHGLAAAIVLLAPRRIVLGGGVSLIGEEYWFAPIRRELDRCVFEPFRGSFDVVPAALGEEVVIHGALALARDAAEALQ